MKIYSWSLIVLLLSCSIGMTQTREVKERSFSVKIYGKGRPMILIPGLACSGDVWESTMMHYQSDYECHVLTLSGFAGEVATSGPFIENVRMDLANYIEKNNLKKPVIVGHSLGGFIALLVGATAPDLVERLVIVDALPFAAALQNPNATAESIAPQAELMRNMIGSQTRDQYLSTQPYVLKTMISDTANVRRALLWGANSDYKKIGQAMYELLTTDIRGDVAKITVPTLVMGTWIGMKPYGVTRESQEALYEKQYAALNGCEVLMADSAKHFIMFDDPTWLYGSMDQFLGATVSKK